MITKVSDKYYIAMDGDPAFEICNAKPVKESATWDLFVCCKEGRWLVSEGMSGKKTCEGETRLKAIREAIRMIGNFTQKRFAEIVALNIRKTGLSPRYKLGDGLTIEQVTDIMCLTGETSQEKPKENKVARTKTNKTEQAQELRAQASTEIATVPDPQPTSGQLDIVPDANIMTAEDAVRIESNIEKSSSNVSKWILQLYRGKAYVARGFPSWDAYYSDITGKSRASAFRAVEEAIQKDKLIEMGVPAKFNQKQIAALKPIIEKGKEAIEKVLKDAKNIVTAKDANEKVKSEFHNTGMLPASAIKKAVEKVVPPTIVEGGATPGRTSAPVDVTEALSGNENQVANLEHSLNAAAAPQAQIDTEAADSPVESVNPDGGKEVHLLHFSACTWHVAPSSGIPTGCLKVETVEGGYVLVPYSAVYDAVNTWPQEFITEQGEYAPPED